MGWSGSVESRPRSQNVPRTSQHASATFCYFRLELVRACPQSLVYRAIRPVIPRVFVCAPICQTKKSQRALIGTLKRHHGRADGVDKFGIRSVSPTKVAASLETILLQLPSVLNRLSEPRSVRICAGYGLCKTADFVNLDRRCIDRRGAEQEGRVLVMINPEGVPKLTELMLLLCYLDKQSIVIQRRPLTPAQFHSSRAAHPPSPPNPTTPARRWTNPTAGRSLSINASPRQRYIYCDLAIAIPYATTVAVAVHR